MALVGEAEAGSPGRGHPAGQLRQRPSRKDAFDDMNRASWDAHASGDQPLRRAPGAGPGVRQRCLRLAGLRCPAASIGILDQRQAEPEDEDFLSVGALQGRAWGRQLAMMAQALAPARSPVDRHLVRPRACRSVHQDQAAFDAEVAETLMQRPATPAEIASALRFLIDAPTVHRPDDRHRRRPAPGGEGAADGHPQRPPTLGVRHRPEGPQARSASASYEIDASSPWSWMWTACPQPTGSPRP